MAIEESTPKAASSARRWRSCARRWRQSGRSRARCRRIGHARGCCDDRGHVPVAHRPRGDELRGQKKVFFLAAEPLTDKITWQNGNKYVPLACHDLHAGCNADAPLRLARRRNAGAGLSEFRVWPVGGEISKRSEEGAARCRVSSPSRRRRSARSTPVRGSRDQAIDDAKPDAIFNVLFGGDLAKFVREGNTRGVFQDRS